MIFQCLKQQKLFYFYPQENTSTSLCCLHCSQKVNRERFPTPAKKTRRLNRLDVLRSERQQRTQQTFPIQFCADGCTVPYPQYLHAHIPEQFVLSLASILLVSTDAWWDGRKRKTGKRFIYFCFRLFAGKSRMYSKPKQKKMRPCGENICMNNVRLAVNVGTKK